MEEHNTILFEFKILEWIENTMADTEMNINNNFLHIIKYVRNFAQYFQIQFLTTKKMTNWMNGHACNWFNGQFNIFYIRTAVINEFLLFIQ